MGYLNGTLTWIQSTMLLDFYSTHSCDGNTSVLSSASEASERRQVNGIMVENNGSLEKSCNGVCSVTRTKLTKIYFL